MSDDKIEVATSSSDDKAAKAELPDRDVYLRIKPNIEGTHVSYALNFSNSSFHEITIRGKSFRCTEIFDQDSSQTEVFNAAIRNRVTDFVQGKSSTILTYGARNTGKRYTLYGTMEEPGIIYHAMKLIFSMVHCNPQPWYTVNMNDKIAVLDEEERVLKVKFQRQIIDAFKIDCNGRKLSLTKRNFHIPRSYAEEYPADMDLSSVWVSVVSFVGSKFYDVLTGEVQSPTLSFREDGSAYFPKLELVHVNTAAQVCQLLIGITATREWDVLPNDRPYVFTIKLLKYQKENAVDTVSVSTLTFCNVSSEKTFNFDRYIRAAHKGGDKAICPCSQSILMMLFKRPLLDQQAVTFLITVDVDSHYITNTMAILKTASLIKKY